MTARIEKLLQKRQQIEAQLKKASRHQAEQDRSLAVRQNLIVGTWLRTNDSEAFSKVVRQLTRSQDVGAFAKKDEVPDQDRGELGQ